MSAFRPHDLIRLHRPAELLGGAPGWVAHALDRAPWAVVRRSTAIDDHLPVGIRGQAREQRWSATTRPENVAARCTPEQLLTLVPELQPRTPAAHALVQLRKRLEPFAMTWGPTGSAGFELATGLPTLRQESDLDIVIRADPHRNSAEQLTHLHDTFAELPARVDAQLDFGFGAVALEELLSGANEVMVKTPTGPVLVPAAPLLVGR